MLQLVLKNGNIVATHEMHQDVRGKYPGSEIVSFSGEIPTDKEGMPLPGDPRTAEEKKLAYMDARRLDYPTVENQLDMLYHDTVKGTTTWKDAITAVKVKFPKPTEIK